MKPLAEQNLYEILEVPTDAGEEDIVRAWDRVSALCAPGALATYTLMAADDAALLGKRLEEALAVLLDPVARQQYDAGLSLTPAPVPCEASASGPEPQRRRPPPPVIRPKPVPPVIPPLREVAPAPEPPPGAPIPLEQVAPAEAGSPAPVAVSAAPAPAPAPAEAPAPVAAAPRERVPVPAGLTTQEIIVGEGTRYTGDVLRRAREARGISLPQLCERTKITRHHVENLEADRYDRLPAAVYLRGILMALAKELRLDGQKVARSYLEAMAAAAPPPAIAPPRASSR